VGIATISSEPVEEAAGRGLNTDLLGQVRSFRDQAAGDSGTPWLSAHPQARAGIFRQIAQSLLEPIGTGPSLIDSVWHLDLT